MGEAPRDRRAIPGPAGPPPRRTAGDLVLRVAAFVLIGGMTVALLFAGGVILMLHSWASHENPGPIVMPLDEQAARTATQLADAASDGRLEPWEITGAVGFAWIRKDERSRVVVTAPFLHERPTACYAVVLSLPLGQVSTATSTMLPRCPPMVTHPVS